jgi:hypothetical protein
LRGEAEPLHGYVNVARLHLKHGLADVVGDLNEVTDDHFDLRYGFGATPNLDNQSSTCLLRLCLSGRPQQD